MDMFGGAYFRRTVLGTTVRGYSTLGLLLMSLLGQFPFISYYYALLSIFPNSGLNLFLFNPLSGRVHELLMISEKPGILSKLRKDAERFLGLWFSITYTHDQIFVIPKLSFLFL
jgi:hypothetical protein